MLNNSVKMMILRRTLKLASDNEIRVHERLLYDLCKHRAIRMIPVSYKIINVPYANEY